jgi:hypothetical protein
MAGSVTASGAAAAATALSLAGGTAITTGADGATAIGARSLSATRGADVVLSAPVVVVDARGVERCTGGDAEAAVGVSAIGADGTAGVTWAVGISVLGAVTIGVGGPGTSTGVMGAGEGRCHHRAASRIAASASVALRVPFVTVRHLLRESTAQKPKP